MDILPLGFKMSMLSQYDNENGINMLSDAMVDSIISPKAMTMYGFNGIKIVWDPVCTTTKKDKLLELKWNPSKALSGTWREYFGHD